MVITQTTLFVTPQAPQLQPTIKEIITAPSFKKALGEILDECHHQVTEHQCESK